LSVPAVLRCGDEGDAVRDLQERLHAAGIACTIDGTFGPATEAAVRAFQAARRLRADGLCGPQTWGALIESAFRLGDRMLYLRQPMLRGDDVAELQRQLNKLGFDAGREDGILGPETKVAVAQFQREAGLRADGIFGPSTFRTLQQVGALADGSVAAVREREALRRGPHQLHGRRIYLAVEPGLDALGASVHRELGRAGALVIPDSSGQDDSVLAAEANRGGADLFLALRTSDGDTNCAYFGTAAFRSEAGHSIAQHIEAELRALFGVTAGPVPRTTPALRETRMPAVVCELSPPSEVVAGSWLATHAPEIAAAVVRGTRQGVERPLETPC
jgi:N-acetylmuramoyl-L-alanine amidase